MTAAASCRWPTPISAHGRASSSSERSRRPHGRARRERERCGCRGAGARSRTAWLDGSFGGPHPRRSDALPTRARHRGQRPRCSRATSSKRPRASRRSARRRRFHSVRAADRVARGPLWPALSVVHDFSYPGHSARAHAWSSLPLRRRTGGPSAGGRGGAGHSRPGRKRPSLPSSPTTPGASPVSGSSGRTADMRTSAAARSCSPATDMAVNPNSCAGTFRRWPTRSISVIPETGRCGPVGRGAGRGSAHHVGLSGPRLGGAPARGAGELGRDHGRRLPGERRGPALQRRDARLLRAGSRRHPPAGRDRLRRLRRPHRCRGPAVRGLPQRGGDGRRPGRAYGGASGRGDAPSHRSAVGDLRQRGRRPPRWLH